MTNINCANLIDLSLENEITCSNTIQIKTENNTQPSEATQEGPLFISPNWRKRDSLDNNPFDCVQNLANRIDDPFDIVEKEACLKAQQTLKPPPEVKLGNLLSLSDDNLLEENQMPESPNLAAAEFNKFKSQDLDLESPPVMLLEKQLPDSVSEPDTDSNPNSSAETTASAKLKKSMEYRKRLLKLSISNAAFNSPITRKPSLEFEDILGTPVSSTLSRAAEFGHHLLSAESPLKLVDEEDSLSQETSNFINSEKIFEADLEMLKIPILNELPSPAVEQLSVNKTPVSPDVVINTPSFENSIPKLEAIKAKLKAKREETNSNHQQEISSLIHSLKSLISSDVIANCKKQQASELLESLRSALKPADTDETLKPPEMLTVAPQPIQRQGTFNIELHHNEEAELDNQPLVQEMPNCMISSSATYDGETADEKQDLNLPEIAPLSAPSSPTHYHYQHNNNGGNPDVNDIMEQLSKLFINNSADKQSNMHKNPTFIVVMNGNQLNPSNINNSHQNIVDAKQRSAIVASYLENYVNDGSPDLTKVNPMSRRRSQSLSIHDKVKIVQLPLQPPSPRSIQKQRRVQMDDSPPVATTPPSSGIKTPEFKSPARMIRRNSYSSGTPYTTQVGSRRTGFGNTIQIKTENNTQPSEATQEGPLFISPNWRKRDSLDNNPFDCVQNLANRIDDPFDIVEKEACLKAQQTLKPPPEVKLGNLLSLSDDNLLEENQMPESPNLAAAEFNKFKSQDLDLESPTVMLLEKQLPDSVSEPDTDSNPNSSAETTASAKLKKSMEYRKRLLKLSISNAAFNSPITRKPSLEFEDILGTPVSSTLSRAAEFGHHLLSAESPLKLVDEEDSLSQETSNFINSEKIFEADLEMLKIPILNELPSPAVEQLSVNKTPVSPDVVINTPSFENSIPKLEAIKAKLKAKREETNSNHQQEISSLIHSLKSLISSDVIANCKKQQASELLESLRSALKPADTDETLKPPEMLTVAPQPIQRQGTFNIELHHNEEAELDNQPLVQEMPNCMISSSATYDGETADEKQDLNLPEIAPLSAPSSPTHYLLLKVN